MRTFDRKKLLNFVGFKPHNSQIDVLNNIKRFNILNCGRRFGKNKVSSYLELEQCLYSNNIVWHVAPTYKIAKIGFKMIQSLLIPIIKNSNFITKIDKNEMIIEFKNNSVWEGKSADNPTSLLGDGPSWITIDECARIPEDIWQETLRPSLMDHMGSALFISTPRGNNWFKKLFILGQDPTQSVYKSFKYTTYDNPHIPINEIKDAKKTMPEMKYRQEILAEFIEDEGQVFRNIRACIKSKFEEPQTNIDYVFSADLAKHEDFTVILVAKKSTKEIIYHERFNQISWTLQKERIINVSKKYNNAIGIIDSTGVGDTIFDDLVRSGIIVEPFKFSQPSKIRLVENLSSALDQETISYPEIPELINELEIFEYTISPNKNFKYSAPPGLHDDEVMALALINKKLSLSNFSFVI